MCTQSQRLNFDIKHPKLYKMSFTDDIKKHLCDYKKEKFPALPNGLWMRSNPTKELGYAFRKKDDTNNDEDENIISYYKEEFLKSRFKTIKRHMYFHHMNSSQAMCINFFFPLLFENKLELITEYLGFPNEKINYSTVQFEKISDVEKKYGYRPTSIDFYFETQLGKKFLFEIKYTEKDFGKAPMDEDHIQKFDKVYKNQIGTAINSKYQTLSEFLKNYQLLRNLIHVGPNSYVVFVFPGENARIKREAEMGKNQNVTEEFKPNILTIEWRNIFDRLNASLQPGKLKNQFEEFWRKYFMGSIYTKG